MNEMYFIKKNVDRLYDGEYTNFLDLKYQDKIRAKMKIDYNIFIPFKDAERVIYYINEMPNISLYEIKSNEILKHQEIMGSIYSLGLDETLFGDIIVDNNRYFVYLFSLIEDYFINNFNMIGNKKITKEKLDINYLKDYERKYKELTLVTSSQRIDTIISRITNINRKDLIDKFKNNEIIVNCNNIKNNSYILKNGDVFSIRKYGKYKYLGVIKHTKKDNLIVKVFKYI